MTSFFLAFNVAANSEWTPVVGDKFGNENFVDINSIQKNGDSVTFWLRKNNKVRDAEGVLSFKVQQTINCRSRENIYRFFIMYDDIDNNGRILKRFSSKELQWEPIPPESIVWFLYEFVCK